MCTDRGKLESATSSPVSPSSSTVQRGEKRARRPDPLLSGGEGVISGLLRSLRRRVGVGIPFLCLRCVDRVVLGPDGVVLERFRPPSGKNNAAVLLLPGRCWRRWLADGVSVPLIYGLSGGSSPPGTGGSGGVVDDFGPLRSQHLVRRFVLWLGAAAAAALQSCEYFLPFLSVVALAWSPATVQRWGYAVCCGAGSSALLWRSGGGAVVVELAWPGRPGGGRCWCWSWGGLAVPVQRRDLAACGEWIMRSSSTLEVFPFQAGGGRLVLLRRSSATRSSGVSAACCCSALSRVLCSVRICVCARVCIL